MSFTKILPLSRISNSQLLTQSQKHISTLSKKVHNLCFSLDITTNINGTTMQYWQRGSVDLFKDQYFTETGPTRSWMANPAWEKSIKKPGQIHKHICKKLGIHHNNKKRRLYLKTRSERNSLKQNVKNIWNKNQRENRHEKLYEFLKNANTQEEKNEQHQAFPDSQDDAQKFALITLLKEFLKRKRILKHIDQHISDHRGPKLITYDKKTIILCALLMFLLRMSSGNKFDQRTHDKDNKYCRKNIAQFIGHVKEDRVPVIKTIESFIKGLKTDSINKLMLSFFVDLYKSKFFSDHPQIFLDEYFLLAGDCVHVHTYDHPHHMDENCNNDCYCCLKRVYNKGTENEKIRWQHNTLVFSFVFLEKLKIPIYYHPIRAKQIKEEFETETDDNFKQECELVALGYALPIIRSSLPRLKIRILLDGLYANKRTIEIAHKNRCEYIIVKKDKCLKTLGRECDGHSEHSNHKKNCTETVSFTAKDGCFVKQKYSWFNGMYLGDNVYTNVLRFTETITKPNDETDMYKCEWLVSQRISKNNCKEIAIMGRLRWAIEDVYNTLKNRGPAFMHGYSRDPASCFKWQGISLLAFGIFELFRFSEVVKKRTNMSQIALTEKLSGELFHSPTVEIFPAESLKIRCQFRYNFHPYCIRQTTKKAKKEIHYKLEAG